MRTITLNLAAGPLVLGPLLAATIRNNKAAIGQARLGQLDPPEMLDLTCTLAQACAARVAPAFTLDQVESVVDMENFGAVFAACWGVSLPDASPGDPAPGEAQQAVPVNPST